MMHRNSMTARVIDAGRLSIQHLQVSSIYNLYPVCGFIDKFMVIIIIIYFILHLCYIINTFC